MLDDWQAENDERALERIQGQLLADYLQSDDDYFVDSLEGERQMYLRDVLRRIVADILERHITAATDEIASAMTDEIEALARDRLADLRAQLEAGDEP